MCWVCVGEGGAERVQLVAAVEPVYIFDLEQEDLLVLLKSRYLECQTGVQAPISSAFCLFREERAS